MHRMLCIQSCGKPAHTGALAPNHVLMFVQNPALGYCAPPCVDEEKDLSRVKVLDALLAARTKYEGPSSQLQSFSAAGSAFRSGVPFCRVVPERFRSGFWSGSGRVLEGSGRVPEHVPEQVPERISGGGSFPERLPERLPRSLRPKPLCAKPRNMHDHQRLGHTVSYALCHAVLAQGLLW